MTKLFIYVTSCKFIYVLDVLNKYPDIKKVKYPENEVVCE